MNADTFSVFIYVCLVYLMFLFSSFLSLSMAWCVFCLLPKQKRKLFEFYCVLVMSIVDCLEICHDSHAFILKFGSLLFCSFPFSFFRTIALPGIVVVVGNCQSPSFQFGMVFMMKIRWSQHNTLNSQKVMRERSTGCDHSNLGSSHCE